MLESFGLIWSVNLMLKETAVAQCVKHQIIQSHPQFCGKLFVDISSSKLMVMSLPSRDSFVVLSCPVRRFQAGQIL